MEAQNSGEQKGRAKKSTPKKKYKYRVEKLEKKNITKKSIQDMLQKSKLQHYPNLLLLIGNY